MDINVLLNPVQVRIKNDAILAVMLGETPKTAKGIRKPTGMTNPCFTAHVSSNPRDPDTKIHNGTLIINFYCDNYQEGNANVELVGKVNDRLVELFDDVCPNTPGYEIGKWVVEEPLGPLFDSDDPGEHYSSVRIGFTIRKL